MVKHKIKEDTYFTAEDNKNQLVFSIEGNGDVKYMVDGKLKTAKNSRSLAVAMGGVINALVAENSKELVFDKEIVIDTLRRSIKHLVEHGQR